MQFRDVRFLAPLDVRCRDAEGMLSPGLLVGERDVVCVRMVQQNMCL